MENISNEAISFIVMIIGISIGWALRGIWDSMKDRKHKEKLADMEYSDGRFRIIENKPNSRL